VLQFHFDLFAVQLVQSKSRLVTKCNQNDVTLLNKNLLILIFAKTCIKALHYMYRIFLKLYSVVLVAYFIIILPHNCYRLVSA